MDVEKEFAQWLTTRPANVQEFAKKYSFRPGDSIADGGVRYWFLGYSEVEGGGVGLIVSTTDPCEDYDTAVATREFICSEHFT